MIPSDPKCCSVVRRNETICRPTPSTQTISQWRIAVLESGRPLTGLHKITMRGPYALLVRKTDMSKLGLVFTMDGNTKVRSHSSGMSQPPHPEPHILASPNASISLAERTKMDSQEPDTAEIQDSAGLPTRPFTLILISHSHAPPLVPKPQLKFDLRKTSNPPKNIRDAYDGRSKRLREHMMAGDDFCALLDTAQTRIGEQMSSFAGPGRGDPGQ